MEAAEGLALASSALQRDAEAGDAAAAEIDSHPPVHPLVDVAVAVSATATEKAAEIG